MYIYIYVIYIIMHNFCAAYVTYHCNFTQILLEAYRIQKTKMEYFHKYVWFSHDFPNKSPKKNPLNLTLAFLEKNPVSEHFDLLMFKNKIYSHNDFFTIKVQLLFLICVFANLSFLFVFQLILDAHVGTDSWLRILHSVYGHDSEEAVKAHRFK